MNATDVRLEGEAGWTPVAPLSALGPIRSFVSGDMASDRLRVRYFRRERDDALVGKVWFGPAAEGPPGHAHGGSIAAVLDEAMGGAAWMLGHRVLARTIRIQFRELLPLGRVVTVEAMIHKSSGRRLCIEATLATGDDHRVTFAEGTGLFVVPVEKSGRVHIFPAAALPT